MAKYTNREQRSTIQLPMVFALIATTVWLAFIFLKPTTIEQVAIELLLGVGIVTAGYLTFAMPIRLSSRLLQTPAKSAISLSPAAMNFALNVAQSIREKTGNESRIVAGVDAHTVEVHVLNPEQRVVTIIECKNINPNRMGAFVEPLFAITMECDL
jgi:hypothetical protein